ncbi:MAG TPA: glutamine-hydrolyzing carbamoyl-phosphate synthase small subunit [Luteitalea sp.]|nr:glutamine-hydrolyzing carbamoyl-phosphate synthase small subunit [Luteitalea sp.]
MKALLALENGQVFEGVAAGAAGETSGEVVFNTSLTGYQEVLTDPSYAGQIVTMTAPLIGNYGVSPEDMESRGPQVAGFVMREESRIASNWRSQMTLKEYLSSHGIVAIADIDTRALTRVLRSTGVMRGVIATGAQVRGEELVEKARAAREMSGADLVKDVTCSAPFDWTPNDEPGATVARDLILEPQRRAGRRLKVAAYDLGMKYNILRRFAEHGVDVRVYPATTPAADLMRDNPDGVFFSNGPGDPAALPYVVDNAKALADANVPVFGICLGHQVLAQALGAKTFKLKFGHRGTNHPVKHLDTGAVEITSQNHGFAVDPETIPSDVEVTHVNLYDNTVEGLKHRTRPIFCVQYHPEAAPGPHDADYLFRQFLDAMEARA